MGLASALSTALTGLTAAETQIDTVGNNLANSQTVGFKSSETVFATQFLQTLGLGSEPTESSGGTNPRQTGLGVQVAEITPDFSQGTIEISASPSDLAIQGDGFFIVESSTGEQLYTRNGIFKTNAQNELVTVTGQRLLGFGVDDSFQLQETELVPLEIPLGSASSAKATTQVVLQGTLTPTGDLADTAEVLESAVLGDGIVPQPDVSDVIFNPSPEPDESLVAVNHVDGGGSHAEGSVFRYKFTFVDDTTGTESIASEEIVVTVPPGNTAPDNAIQLLSLPDAAGEYSQVNIYRTTNGGSDFFLLDSAVPGGNYTDDNSVALSATALDETSLTGNYTYKITFFKNGSEESRPSMTLPAQNVTNGRLHLRDLPTPPVPVGSEFPAYDEIRIYRNLSTDPSTFYLVDSVNPGDDYTDSKTDAQISDLTNPLNQVLDEDGPKISSNTLLTNVLRRDEDVYENIFAEGTLSFTGRKGGRSLTEKTFTVTDTTTVQQFIDFVEDALGIRVSSDDPQNPVPSSINNLLGATTPTLSSGISIQGGKIRIVSNNGEDNAISLGLSAFQIDTEDGNLETPSIGFGSVQDARGRSAVSDFIMYDSLGIPLNVRITAVLESRTGTTSTYRWFADSADNDPLVGEEIGVGTGLITFDGEGNFVSSSNDTLTIERRNVPSASPLDVEIDFSQISGLQAGNSSLNASYQDGSAPGTLNNFSISEDGNVRGVFTNGVTRDLGKIQLARFSNPTGLEQRGLNMYVTGANSGLPVVSDAGSNGLGTIISGAVELSNTDIGKNLIDLVLATTHYRGNSRVITAAQQLLDELLNLRR